MDQRNLGEDQISFVIDKVIERLQVSKSSVTPNLSSPVKPHMSSPVKPHMSSPVKPHMSSHGLTGGSTQPYQALSGSFDSIDEAIEKASEAQKNLESLSFDKRKEVILKIREACRAQTHVLAKLAVEETGLGRVEDKISKNLLVINKTPGIEDVEPKVFTGDHGLTLIERAPYGVIGAITPCTNPTETIICNSIGMIAAGNAVVFNAHPMAKHVCAKIVDIINRAIVNAGGPVNVLSCISNPTIESAQQLMRHKNINLLVVTGGPAVVKEAMNSGKKVIAAGPGNPPAVVDETADIDQAARNIILGSSLDNNIVCIAEKEIICVASVADALKVSMKRQGAYELNRHQIKQLEQVVLKDTRANKKFIGKNASVILKEIGITVGEDVRLILCETPKDHLFVKRELLMPVLPLVRVANVDEAIEFAKYVEHGYGHTATMHSKNIDNLHKMAKTIRTAIFVKNGPSYAGLGLTGEGPTSFTIASPTGEGLTSAKNFTKELRCVLKDRFRII